ncbi:hypothetical protein NMY22_g9147 [Coprinellus aureogranulatus]|nr:hypothetical protein NMY22_g9147 [Coprinellus aureogranulatus]
MMVKSRTRLASNFSNQPTETEFRVTLRCSGSTPILSFYQYLTSTVWINVWIEGHSVPGHWSLRARHLRKWAVSTGPRNAFVDLKSTSCVPDSTPPTLLTMLVADSELTIVRELVLDTINYEGYTSITFIAIIRDAVKDSVELPKVDNTSLLDLKVVHAEVPRSLETPSTTPKTVCSQPSSDQGLRYTSAHLKAAYYESGVRRRNRSITTPRTILRDAQKQH